MAQVTYRGVKYNTNDKNSKTCQEKVHTLTDRGTSHDEKIAVCA